MSTDKKKILNFLNNHIEKIVFAILFVIPFFWYKYPQIDLGGDAGRLYLLDPKSLMLNESLFPYSKLGILNPYLARYYILPLHGFFLLLKTLLFNNAYLLNVVVQSLILSISFAVTYRFLIEIIKKGQKDGLSKLFFVTPALMYTLSPLFIYDFQRANVHIYSIVLYPLFFYMLLLYVNSGKLRYLVWNVIIAFIFTLIFSTFNSPWFFGFFGPVFFFMFCYSVLHKRNLRFLFGSVFLIITIGLAHLYYLYPLAQQLINPEGASIYFSGDLSAGGLDYFLTIQPHVKYIYNFLNQPPLLINKVFGNLNYGYMKTFGLVILPVFLVYPLTILMSLFKGFHVNFKKEDKLTSLLSILFFLMVAFFETASLGLLPVDIYSTLFKVIPGFNMFRHFYGKFSLSFAFFYAVIFCYSLINLYEHFRETKYLVHFKKFLYLLIVIISIAGIPLLGGYIVNSQTPGSTPGNKDVKVSLEFSPEYLSSLDYLIKYQRDAKVLMLPFSMENYQVIKGVDNGAYLGPSANAFLSGKTHFSGFAGFYNQDLAQTYFTLFFEQSPEKLKRFIGMQNVGLIYHNSDEFIYKYFNETPWGQFKQLFPTQQSLSMLTQVLGGKLAHESGPYRIYEMSEYYLPHIYIPQKIHRTDQIIYEYFKGHDFNIDPVRLAFYTGDFMPKDIPLQDDSFEFKEIPNIFVSRINPVKFYIHVSDAKDPYVLVLNDPLDTKWKIYLKENSDIKEINNERMSNIGKTYAGYVSKFIKNAPQKPAVNNYFDGQVTESESQYIFLEPNTFETWGKKPIAESTQYRVNGYATSWYITPQDTKGLTEYDLVVEYTGHQNIYLTGLLSLTVVVFAGMYLILDHSLEFINAKRRKK